MTEQVDAQSNMIGSQSKLGPVMACLSVFVAVALAVVGSSSRFVATALGADVVAGASLIIAVTIGAAFWRAFGSNGSVAGPKLMLAAAVLAGGGFLLALGDLTALACWYTDLTGSRGSQVVTVAGQASGGRYGCHRLQIAEEQWIGGGRALCASPGDADRISLGQKIVLTGPRSGVGMDADPVDLATYIAHGPATGT
jgi:hypothetical protein